jgi:hypothetical protein
MLKRIAYVMAPLAILVLLASSAGLDAAGVNLEGRAYSYVTDTNPDVDDVYTGVGWFMAGSEFRVRVFPIDIDGTDYTITFDGTADEGLGWRQRRFRKLTFFRASFDIPHYPGAPDEESTQYHAYGSLHRNQTATIVGTTFQEGDFLLTYTANEITDTMDPNFTPDEVTMGAN